MKIVIPSHNRPENEKYLSYVPKDRLGDVTIVVRAGEQEKLYERHLQNGVSVIGVPGLTGIHDKRDWIAREFAGEKIIVMDDDVALCKSVPVGPREWLRLRPLEEGDFEKMEAELEILLDAMPFGLLGNTIFPHKVGPKYRLNKWNGGSCILNLREIDADILNYREFRLCSDMVAFLNVISAGYDTFWNCDWMIDLQQGDTGGCHEFRTPDLIEECFEAIHRKFPLLTKWYQAKYTFPGHDRAARSLQVIPQRIQKMRRRGELTPLKFPRPETVPASDRVRIN